MKDFIKYNVPIINVEGLPSYPIIKMDDTLNRFVEWVEPLVSASVMEETKKTVDEFLKNENSRKLEEKIVELGSRENDSWIFDYWVKAHLLDRGPISPHINVPLIYENQKLLDYLPLQRVAIIMHYVAAIYKDFKKNGSGKYYSNGKCYSSDEFHGMLGSINDIKAGMNEYYINDELSEYIVFAYKNHFYNIQVIKNGEVIPANEILSILENVISKTVEPLIPNANYVTIGVDRDESAKLLNGILENTGNLKAYEKIKDSIFVMNYDDNEAIGVYDELDKATYDREYVNRWQGKGLQISCTKNGVLSFIGDHAFMDGGIEIYFVERLKKYIEESEISFRELKSQASIEEITFDLSTDVKKRLLDLKMDFDQCMDSFETRYVSFEGLSREDLKKKGILSGDGFIHLAFQVAQYMTYEYINNTYISVDCRKFFRGRTEVNRPVTNESVGFAKEFVKKEKSNEQLRQMMTNALNEHHRRVKLCQSGQGVNRFLYVLESVYEDYGKELGIINKPDLFDIEAFKLIANCHMSTTSVGNSDVKYLAFPPVEKEGFGIYYMVKEKSFMVITAYNDEVETMDTFIENLKICIDGMLVLLK